MSAVTRMSRNVLVAERPCTVALMSVAVGLEVTGALSLIILTMHRGIRMFRGEDLEPETGHDR